MSILDLKMNPHYGVGVALLLLAMLSPAARAQTATTQKPAATDPATASPNTAEEPKPSTATPKASDAKAPDTTQLSPKDARQAQIAADTDRLYQLAQELKAEVAKSNKDTLSLSVIKKAAEVEKLAHSLKDRMKSE
jgi:hypothetical protein